MSDKRLLDGDKLTNQLSEIVANMSSDTPYKRGYIDAVTDFLDNIKLNKYTIDESSNQGEAAILRDALEKCLVGGNSLSSVIIGWNLPEGYEQWTYEQASHYFYNECLMPQQRAYEKYETWLCWKSIREAGEVVDG